MLALSGLPIIGNIQTFDAFDLLSAFYLDHVDKHEHFSVQQSHFQCSKMPGSYIHSTSYDGLRTFVWYFKHHPAPLHSYTYAVDNGKV